MRAFPELMDEYRVQIERGYIQEAYRGLMGYFRELRAHFSATYPDFSVPGSIYYGYMDMTYFSIVPEFLRRRKLKIAIVFVHDKFRFEVWLSGSNRGVQAEYWNLLKEGGWQKHDLSSNPRAEDYVTGHILDTNPDFRNLDALTVQIETGTLAFIRDVEGFLSGQGN